MTNNKIIIFIIVVFIVNVNVIFFIHKLRTRYYRCYGNAMQVLQFKRRCNELEESAQMSYSDRRPVRHVSSYSLKSVATVEK